MGAPLGRVLHVTSEWRKDSCSISGLKLSHLPTCHTHLNLNLVRTGDTQFSGKRQAKEVDCIMGTPAIVLVVFQTGREKVRSAEVKL